MTEKFNLFQMLHDIQSKHFKAGLTFLDLETSFTVQV